jgi:hypothetical protein
MSVSQQFISPGDLTHILHLCKLFHGDSALQRRIDVFKGILIKAKWKDIPEKILIEALMYIVDTVVDNKDVITLYLDVMNASKEQWQKRCLRLFTLFEEYYNIIYTTGKLSEVYCRKSNGIMFTKAR